MVRLGEVRLVLVGIGRRGRVGWGNVWKREASCGMAVMVRSV